MRPMWTALPSLRSTCRSRPASARSPTTATAPGAIRRRRTTTPQVTFSYQVTDGTTPVAASATLDINPVSDAPPISRHARATTVSRAGRRRSIRRGWRDRHHHLRLPPGRRDLTLRRQQGHHRRPGEPHGARPASSASSSPTARSTTMTATRWSTTCSTIRVITTCGTRMSMPTRTTTRSAGTRGAIRARSSAPSLYLCGLSGREGGGHQSARLTAHQSGWNEGPRALDRRSIRAQYLAANPDVAAAHVDPLAHFLQYGAQEGRQPTAPTELIAANGFDYIYYLKNNPDVAAAHVDPLEHFQTFGWHEGRNPNALFDTNGYLATYGDVAAAQRQPARPLSSVRLARRPRSLGRLRHRPLSGGLLRTSRPRTSIRSALPAGRHPRGPLAIRATACGVSEVGKANENNGRVRQRYHSLSQDFCYKFRDRWISGPPAPPGRRVFPVSSIFCERNRGFRRRMGTSHEQSEPREFPLALPIDAIGPFSPIAVRVVRFQVRGYALSR